MLGTHHEGSSTRALAEPIHQLLQHARGHDAGRARSRHETGGAGTFTAAGREHDGVRADGSSPALGLVTWSVSVPTTR